MEVKIYANETTTVLEALRSYRKHLEDDIFATNQSTGNYRMDLIVKDMERRKETINRVIDRIEEM